MTGPEKGKLGPVTTQTPEGEVAPGEPTPPVRATTPRPLVDPVVVFTYEPCKCCECCDMYCPESENPGPNWESLFELALGGVEFVGTRHVIVRRDQFDAFPESVNFISAPKISEAPWATVPSTVPEISTRRQIAGHLDRLDRAGFDLRHGDNITHLYLGTEHVGWTKFSDHPTAITRADLPLVRAIAKDARLTLNQAAIAVQAVRSTS